MAFSPGRLSAKSRPGLVLKGYTSHAAFEGDCSLCHQPLKAAQATLCLDCHSSVAKEIRQKIGTHSLIDQVEQCFDCHTDHHGENFDPSLASFASFDHSRTRFSLARHQVNYDTSPMECKACHQADTGFTISDSTCALCHATKDLAFVVKHSHEFGEDCTDCHDGRDKMADFDHQATDFPLEGHHAGLPCTDCHNLQNASDGSSGGEAAPISLFKGTSKECTQCHNDDDPHPGLFSKDCAACHNPKGWIPALYESAPFEHVAKAGFSLVRHRKTFEGDPLSCNDCHQGKTRDIGTDSCINCHSQGEERTAFMARHQEQYGLDCTSCHDGLDRMHDFVHEKVFPLEGKHAEIACQDCHKDKVFAGTPKECVHCHEEPKIHAGFFGVQCQLCHKTQAWAPALLHMHSFPLDHGKQGEVACRVCHPSRYTETTCYGCHEHQPEEIVKNHQEKNISLQELENCAKCHPSGRVKEE